MMITTVKDDTIEPPVAEERERPRQRLPTSADVARLAGVSRTTVSNVLNDAPESRISEETRVRVLAAADQLGYVPNAVASALRAGRSQLVLIPANALAYSAVQSIFYRELARRLAELGYTVLFHNDLSYDGYESARQWAALRPAAVLVDPRQLSEPALEILRKAGVQAIIPLNSKAMQEDAPALTGEPGATAAEHLVATGHQQIGVIVPGEPSLTEIGLARLAEARRIAHKHGASVERIDLVLDERDAFVLAQKWRRRAHPSGIFAYNDEHAMMLMRALLDNGLAVPGDVAIVGCDNLPLCEFLRPRLTSLWPVPDQVGVYLAEHMHALIEGRTAPVNRMLPRSEMVIRESG